MEDRSIKEDLVYQHLFHHENEGLQVVIIDKARTEFIIGEREAQWAYRLKTLTPLGLTIFLCSILSRVHFYM